MIVHSLSVEMDLRRIQMVLEDLRSVMILMLLVVMVVRLSVWLSSVVMVLLSLVWARSVMTATQ